MTRTVSVTFALGLVLWSTPAWSQTSKPRPTGRVSFYTTAGLRSPKGAESEASGEFATSITFRTADLELKGLEVGVDVRHTGYSCLLYTSDAADE